MRQFVRKLTIQDRKGRIRPLGVPEPEQIAFLEMWRTHKNILVLKPRQVGMTTISQACAFHEALIANDPINILTLAHESGACTRVNSMLRQFWRGLPRQIRGTLEPDNSSEIGLSRNGATMSQYMAGGRGQGRSHTYHIALFTEMAFYPKGSASVNGRSEADRDAWASVLATMHDGPYKRIIVESTGDGPSGQYYDLVDVAKKSDDWGFLFYRWFDFSTYAIDAPPDWKRTSEEEELAALHNLDDRQLAWRRRKLVDQGYTEMRFRREYPATWEDPFLLAESTWFDGELLNRVLGALRTKRAEGVVRRYLPVEEGRSYFAGGDTSGGTGRDMAVLVILRDDYEVAFVWCSNITPPHEQANAWAKECMSYNALVLVEENNYGKQVIVRMEKLGARTWKNEKNKNFWTQGGRAGQSKKMVYGYARSLVNDSVCVSAAVGERPMLNDPDIIRELIIVREDARGNIQAPEGKHDDFADGYVLALWCGRYFFMRIGTTRLEPERGKLARARRLRI